MPETTPNTEMLTSEEAWKALYQVIDPELNCNIVDLGLVYGIEIAPSRVKVTMTLTTSSCPMAESIASGVQNVLLAFPNIEEVDVDLVWDPPWNPDRMTPAGKRQLGL
jgi:metal-sulfur cluster biosynthetic enzyme